MNSGHPKPILLRYLLVIAIPIYLDQDGSPWIDEAWHKDLVKHLDYLHSLSLLCPVESRNVADSLGLRLCSLEKSERLRIVLVPSQATYVRALLSFPQTVWRIFRAVKQAQVVHCGVVGWPYPIGWIASALALMLDRFLIIVLESAPWRGEESRKSPVHRVISAVYERMAAFYSRRADLLIATQPEYISSLGGDRQGGCFVWPASWIDGRNIVSQEIAESRWNDRLRNAIAPLRILFAGRLVEDKGISLLLAVVDEIRRRNLQVTIDVVGDGPLKELLQRKSAQPADGVLTLRNSVAYGAPFFELISGYDLLMVPSLTDEQPRVVFDAYSQAIPVIATDTDGLKSCVDHGTGWIFPRGSVEGFMECVTEMCENRDTLKIRGMNALHRASTYTHEVMHYERWKVLDASLPHLR